MNQFIKFTIIFLLCLVSASAYAQDLEKIRTTLTAAQTAYDGGNYRTAIAKVKEVEQLVGSTTKPATSYIKIMSYYKLKDYTNCVQSAEAYLGDKPKQDETIEEIRKVLSDSQGKIRQAEKEKRQKALETYSTSFGKEKIFHHNFKDGISDWHMTAKAKVETFINKQGYFEIKSKNDVKPSIWTDKINIDQSKDFEIETSVRSVSGRETTFTGLIWGGKLINGSHNRFRLTINGHRIYQVDKWINLRWHDYHQIENRLIVKSGFNKLTLRKIGNTYYFFVNEKFIYKMPFEKFYGSDLGIDAIQKSNTSIDYISVSYLTESSNDFTKPEFKGGMAALRQFLSDNLVYPEKAQKSGIQGRTVVRFIVEKDGSVSDVQVLKGFDPDCDKAAVDAAKATSGQWKAGISNGEKVRVSFDLPIDFKL